MPETPFSKLLKQERARSGLSFRQLADRVPFTHSHLNRMELGERNAPDREEVILLAEALEADVDAFLDAAGYKGLDARANRSLTLEWIIPEDAEQPDAWELQAMKEIEHIDWGDLDPRRDDSFWFHDRTDRKRLFRFWKNQAEEVAELKRKRHIS